MLAQNIIDICEVVAGHNPNLFWYAITDSAQDESLPEVLGRPSRSLFNAELGSPLAKKSPHLVELPPPGSGAKCWAWINSNGRHKPSITIVSWMKLDTGFFHYDADGWIANDELSESAENSISVKEDERETFVAGVGHRKSVDGEPDDVCFSTALIREQGMVTGFLCSQKNDIAMDFSRLFSEYRVISTVR